MLEFTMQQVLESDLDIPHEYSLYVVRDGDVVFYVGMSTDPLDCRVYNHVYGGYGSGPSHLGRVVRMNMPESLEWQVQFFDPREVVEGNPLAKELYMSKESKAREGEIALISRLKPCLNVTYNRHGRELPKRYKDVRLDLETTVSDFIPFE